MRELTLAAREVHETRFIDLFHAEIVLNRAAKHLMQQIGMTSGAECLRVAEAHKIVCGLLLAVQIERDVLLAQKETR